MLVLVRPPLPLPFTPDFRKGILYDLHKGTRTSIQLPYPPSSVSPEVNNRSTRDGSGGGLAHDKSPNRIR